MTTADDYLRSVSFELGDLPWGQRQDLLAEIREHLDELPEGTDLEARLGPPEECAAGLRGAAGLERRHGPKAFLQARRPRTLALAALALAVVGLAVGAVVWVQSYQPIDFAGGSFSPAGAEVAPAGNSASVVFRTGHSFRLGTSVLNSGPFTVRVRGVALPPGLPVKARLLMSPSLPDTSGFHGPFTPFHPFSLEPGRVRVLLLKGVYACQVPMPAHGAAVVGDFSVRFSYLWRTATVAIPIDPELSIVLPRGCPAKP